MNKYIICILTLLTVAMTSAQEIQTTIEPLEKENPLIGDHSTIKKDEPAADAKWEDKWTALCKYDDFCHRLKNPADSSWYNPNRQSLEILKSYSNEIKKASKLYGVDPKALTASFLADLTIIPNHEGEIREHLARKAIGKDTAPYSAQFPLGLVYERAAVPVEEMAAKVEGRTKRTPQEISALLDTPEGTIYYGAAVLKDAQDTYKKYGVDVSSHPDILATLYNLGKVEPKAKALAERIEKAKSMKASGATAADLEKEGLSPDMLAPRNNFFGLFTDKNMPLIEGILDPAKAPKYKNGDPVVCEQRSKELKDRYNLILQSQKNVKSLGPKKLDSVYGVFKNVPKTGADFKTAMTSAKGIATLCPAPGKLTANQSELTYYCQLPTNSTSVHTTYVEFNYKPAFEFKDDPKAPADNEKLKSIPASIDLCYIDILTWDKTTSTQTTECRMGNGKVFDRSETYHESNNDFGRNESPIPADVDVFVAENLPISCIVAGPNGNIPVGAQSAAPQGSSAAPATNMESKVK